MMVAAHNTHGTTRSIAWIVSIGIHLGIGVVAFFITWSVIRAQEDLPRVVTSSWHEQVDESSILPMALPAVPDTAIEMPALPALPTPESAVQDGLAVLHQVVAGAPLPELARREQESEVQFMGLDAVSAKRIVYVVDASGSMLLHLSTVLEELERSLRTLHPKQEFGIVFFKKDEAISVPPKRSLVSANAGNISKAMEWIHTSGKVIPSGGSNPINAMKSAMRMKPDVIYLLSENITGAGRYEVSPDEIFASLEKLNPVDPRNGLRRVQINCIEYLTQDSLGTMQRIAEIHGGVDGYTFIDRGRVGQ